VFQLDVGDEEAVTECLISHRSMIAHKRLEVLCRIANGNVVTIVIHTASSIDPGLARPLVSALGKVKQVVGEDTHFIHVGRA
jgi:hypothetical protein